MITAWKRLGIRNDWLAIVVMVVLAAVQSQACGSRRQPAVEDETAPPAGEPEKYSATVIRTIEIGERRDVNESREFKSGEMRRDEWLDHGHNRVAIWRPDLKRGFLLDPDAEKYSEIEITPTVMQPGQAGVSGRDRTKIPEDSTVEGVGLQGVDRVFDAGPSPDRVERRRLPSDVIDGHQCSVYEERSSFPDGHTETAMSYRAIDLAGLILRIKTITEPGGITVKTERRDVRLVVPDGAFVVPPGFRKVPRLDP